MKRFKGFISGKSRRKSLKQSSIDEDAAETTMEQPAVLPAIPDDNSTVYAADFDASVAGGTVSSMSVSNKSVVLAEPLQVILLIMDPSTRRFELLQLEFDSEKAKVSDIFAQIPTAATEDILKKAKYRAAITTKGEEMKHDDDLSQYVRGCAVVIAVPETTTESLEKCAQMSSPILTNSKVVKMLHEAGVNPEDLPKKQTPKVVSRAPPAQPKVEKKQETKVEPNPVTPAKPVDAPKEVKEEEKDSYFFVGILFAIFMHLFVNAHYHLSSPLQPGSILPPGKERSHCGLLGFMPFTSCSNRSVKMGTDGVLDIFEGDKIIFSLAGNVCEDSVEGCVDGLEIKEDGVMMIGGEKAKAKAKTKKLIFLSPWPLSEDVTYPTAKWI